MKSKNAESKLKRHMRLINAGKMSHVFEEEDDVDDYIDALNYVEKHEKEETTEKARELEDLRKSFQQQLKQLKQSEMKLRTELRQAQEQLNLRSRELDDLQQQLEKQEITDDAGQYVVEMLEDEPEVQLKGIKKSLKQEEIEIIDDDSHPGPSSSGRQAMLDPEMEDDDTFDLDEDDDDEDQIETRYNCDPEEYAAIEKAVRVRFFNP